VEVVEGLVCNACGISDVSFKSKDMKTEKDGKQKAAPVADRDFTVRDVLL
jgi:hypothetical protein